MKRRGKFEAAPPAPRKDKGWKNPILQTYLTSLLSLVLCCTMFLGTTMAWFTDDVTNTGNQIYVGTLAVDALHKNGEEWVSLNDNKEHTVFSEDVIWSPGQFASETMKVVNEGNLPLKYRVELLLNAEKSALPAPTAENPVTMEDLKEIAQYITVSVAEGEVTTGNVDSWTSVKAGSETPATLRNIVEKNIPIYVSNKLEAPVQTAAEGETVDNSASEDVFSIGIQMSESTPSKYMGWKLAFNIKFVAYQVAEGAVIPWDGVTADTAWFEMTTPATAYTISEASQLAGLAKLVNSGTDFSGITVTLARDIDLNGKPWTSIGAGGKTFSGTFDGAGHTISNLYVDTAAYYVSEDGATTGAYGYGFFGELSGAKIEDLTFAYANVNMDDDIGNTAGVVAGIAKDSTLADIKVQYSAVGGSKHIGGLLGDAEGAVTVTNCSVSNTTIQGAYNCAALIGFADQAVRGGGNTASAITWIRSGSADYVNLTAPAEAVSESAPVSGLYYVNSVSETEKAYYTAWSDTYSYPMADGVRMESGETVQELPNGAFTSAE